MQAEWFGPYRLEELIGRGGMGEVFRATDTARKRVVALKRLPASLAADPSYQRRFRSESEIAAQLRSAHVIPIHDYGEINGQLYIDMRLVNGEDVTDRLDRRGPMSPHAAVDVIRQTASALDAAHAMNLIHRDVKPSNILLSPEDGRDGHDFVYLVDFGIARAADRVGELTGTGGVMGTPDYMAPERFEGSPISHAVDVYALACVLHKLLTGGAPFRAESLAALMYAHLTATPPRASLMRPGIPAHLDWVIARGLAKDPRERFATAGELAAAAHAALSSTARPRCRHRRRRRPRHRPAAVRPRPPPSTYPGRRRGHRGAGPARRGGHHGRPDAPVRQDAAHRTGVERPEEGAGVGEPERQRSPDAPGRPDRHQAADVGPRLPATRATSPMSARTWRSTTSPTPRRSRRRASRTSALTPSPRPPTAPSSPPARPTASRSARRPTRSR